VDVKFYYFLYLALLVLCDAIASKCLPKNVCDILPLSTQLNLMGQLSTAELPQALLNLFTEIQQTKTPLTVFHNGQPWVIIYPATTPKQRPAFGSMKGSGEILGDIVMPALPENVWEVLQ